MNLDLSQIQVLIDTQTARAKKWPTARRVYPPSKPKMFPISFKSDLWDQLGANLKEDPARLSIMFASILRNSADDQIIKALSELLFIAKLKGIYDEDIKLHDQNLKKLELNYQNSLLEYNNKLEEQKQRKNSIPDLDIVVYWKQLAQQLETEVNLNTNLSKLSANSALLVQILNNQSSIVHIHQNGDFKINDWEVILNFHPDHIANIFREILKNANKFT